MIENFDDVNHLVLNFYPDGYSIAVKLNQFPVFTTETILETARIPYEETSLLDYIENEELPPLLVEMIDSSPKLSQYKIWHNSCLILEVRDKIEPPNPDGNFFIFLKPTNLSMLYDVLNLTGSNGWSTQERLQLESQIVLHNSPSLILEPEASDQTDDTNGVASAPTDWSSSDSASKVDASSNKYPALKGRRLSYKTRLKDIYINRPIPVHNTKTNGCGKVINSHNSSISKISNNIRSKSNNSRVHDLHPNQNAGGHDASAPESLPPELTLQQFLAAKRTTKKKSLPFGHIPRFHRFKTNSNHHR